MADHADPDRADEASLAGDPAPPDAFDVLAATLHPETRVVDLGDRAVVRTPPRPDDPAGNALHLTAGRADHDSIVAALAEARTRLADPRATPRVVARRHGDPRTDTADAPHAGDRRTDTADAPHAADRRTTTADAPDAADRAAGAPVIGRAVADVAGPSSTRRRHVDVLVLPDAVTAAGEWPRRVDVTVRPPADPRAWHGVTVLQRHAAPDDGVEVAARARGGRDELLRWLVDGRRRMVGEGRARVLLAERFGTPVAAATLVWAPWLAVGPDTAGLAVVTDVVVHPAHRRLGVARTLVRTLVERHLGDFPRARVATVAPTDLRPALLRHGWRLHDRLVEVVDAPAPETDA